jgi:hypothetical protein
MIFHGLDAMRVASDIRRDHFLEESGSLP